MLIVPFVTTSIINLRNNEGQSCNINFLEIITEDGQVRKIWDCGVKLSTTDDLVGFPMDCGIIRNK